MISKSQKDDRLANDSGHLFYEMEMMAETAYLLAQIPTGPGRASRSAQELVMDNALLESFLIHARGLIGFLLHGPSSRFPENASAEVYFDDPSEWSDIRPTMERKPESYRFLNALWRRISRAVAHLTNDETRRAISEKRWDFPRIGRELSAVLKDFIERVPPRRMAPDYEERFHKFEQRISGVLTLQRTEWAYTSSGINQTTSVRLTGADEEEEDQEES